MDKQNEKKKLSTESFPYYRFEGSHIEIGKQFGETCTKLIKNHLSYALKKLEEETGVSNLSDIEKAALDYRPYVKEYAPTFDEEIQGIAEGANISLGSAYFLQLRAEMIEHFKAEDHECTTFALQSEATRNHTPLAGQNSDLPSFYSECFVVVEIVPDVGPKFLMLTPAGQVSYIGINNRGMGVFGNFITCDGWRKGFPRYMLTRLALTTSSVEEATNKLEKVYKASSRNLMMVDTNNNAIDLEITPKMTGKVYPNNGFITHSNHFVSQIAEFQERKTGEDFENSVVRRLRLKQLIESDIGNLDITKMQNMFRDRGSYPHTICREKGDYGTGTTAASTIAVPSEGQIWAAIGPPSNYEYRCYSFS